MRMRTSSPRARHRGGTLLVTLVLTLAFLAAACGPAEAPPPPGAPTAPPDAVTATIHQRTNADRGARGLGALAWNPRLAHLAGEWATYLAGARQFRHRDLRAALDSPGFESYAALGENILVAPRGTNGDQMHNAWMASPSHAANIFGSYDSMGVGVASGGDGNVRAVVNFGRHF